MISITGELRVDGVLADTRVHNVTILSAAAGASLREPVGTLLSCL